VFQKLKIKSNKVYLFVSLFFGHQIYYSSKSGYHWDDIGYVWSAGRSIQKAILSITDFSNPILDKFIIQEMYGVFVTLPMHIFTRLMIRIEPLVRYAVETPYFVNEFDFYYFIRHCALNLYVVMMLILIFRILEKNYSSDLSLWFIIFLTLYPSFNGHAIFNPMDVPLSLNIFLASTYYLHLFSDKKNFQDISRKQKSILILLLASCILMRVTSVIFLAPLFIFVYSKNIQQRLFFKININIFIGVSILYYFGTPPMWKNPISYLSQVLAVQFDNPWRGETLTNGNFVKASDPPASYLSEWFAYKTPIVFIIFILISFIYFKKVKKMPLWNYSIFIIFYTFTLHAAFSPLTYNEIRHYLFLIPFFVFLATSGFELIKINSIIKPGLLIIFTLGYLVVTQLPFDQYKYAYVNEIAPSENISNYCSENINGCGDWLTDYLNISGKETASMLQNYEMENLYICSPAFSTTMFMNHEEIEIENFWIFKDDIPVQNETSGFKQYKLIYSDAHFKDALFNQNITDVYISSLYYPMETKDLCEFYEIQEFYNIDCQYVDSIDRTIRNSSIYFSMLSKCSFTKIAS
jgi:hypothetical protein